MRAPADKTGTNHHRVESRKRSLAKMLVYRANATALLAGLTWIFTGNAGETGIVTVLFTVISTAVYYFLERMWNNVNWGIEIREDKRQSRSASEAA